MAKHLTARNIAEDFGETSRHWTKLAAAGAIPGAFQPKDKATWLFDVDAFRAWHAAGQQKVARLPAVKEPPPPKRGAPTEKQKKKKAAFEAEIDMLVKGALRGR